jgi:MFS family permease
MKLLTIFQPRVALTRDELRRGLRALTWEGMASTGFSSITSSTFLVAFALALGANNFQIGLLASLPFITDLLQIPAVWLVEKLRQRKAIVLFPWLISQLFWIPVALIPVFMDIPGDGAISLLLGLMAVRGIINAFTNCGWNSWMRDLVPRNILGRYFARRESLSTVMAVVLGLGAGYFLDYWNAGGGGVIGYSFVFLVGLLFFGLVSPAMIWLIPEPMMPPVTVPRTSFVKTITAPLREKNYRHFMKFLMFWGFAANMAFPFLAVFMLQQLKLSIFVVVVLTTLSEIFVVISLRFWGPFIDKFGSKVGLYLSSILFLAVLLGWAGIAVPGNRSFMLPVLIALHIVAGIAVAGITLATGTLSFKIAPYGRATPYLAGSSLADSAGAGLGAIAGGFLADWLTGRTLEMDLSGVNPLWSDSIQFTGYHFLFFLAFIVGLVTLRTLQGVRETGATRNKVILPVLLNVISTRLNRLSTTPVISYLSIFTSGFWKKIIVLGKVKDIIIVCHENADKHALQIVPVLLRELERKPPSCGVYG